MLGERGIEFANMMRKRLEEAGLIVVDFNRKKESIWICIFDEKKHNTKIITDLSMVFACRGSSPLELVNILKCGIDHPRRKYTYLSDPHKALEYGKEDTGQVLSLYDWKFFQNTKVRKENLDEVKKELVDLYIYPLEMGDEEYLVVKEDYSGYDIQYGRLVDHTLNVHPYGIIYIHNSDKPEQLKWFELALNEYMKIH
jgi:hypothetical protein